jgi:hypothetical protein
MMPYRVNLEEDLYAKVMLYGLPGSGKTRLAGSAALDPRMAPVLYLDAAGNPLSLRDYAQKPDILRVESLKDLNGVYSFLNGGQDAGHPLVKELGLRTDYKTIVFDGITELQRFGFAQLTGSERIGPGDMPKGVEIQQYGSILRMMTNLAQRFFALDMHVIVTALEREDQDQASGTITYRPLLAGQAAGEFPAYAYVLARLSHVGRVQRRDLKDVSATVADTQDSTNIAFFKPTERMMAKDQLGIGMPYMFDPTMTKILDALGW